MTWLLVITGLAWGLISAPWLLAWAGRRYGTDPTPMGTTRQTYVGLDDALRQRTVARRERAEAIIRDARQLETRDDRASKIHLVG